VTPRRYGSDIVVDFLRAAGIDHVALNPGASFRGLHDSLGIAENPETIVTLHEEVAVGIAHGYAKSAGRPMAVFLHDQVGLHHAAMALFNAYVDAVPMLVIGGTGPADVTRRRPWIDWIHSGNPEASVIRDVIKWDVEPASLEALPESLARALRIAQTPPMGPVYVGVDALLQEAEAGDIAADSALVPLGPPVAAPNAVVEELAAALVAAERPVFLIDRGARGASAPLLELAEALAAAVVDLGGRSFPAEHWADQTGAWHATMGVADLVVALEMRDVTWGVTSVDLEDRGTASLTPPGCRVVGVGLAELRHRGFLEHEAFAPGVERITAEVACFLTELAAAVAAAGPDSGRVASRRSRLEAAHREQRESARAQAQAAASAQPIAPAYLAASLGRALEGHDWQLANGVLGGWPRKLWAMRDEDSYLGRSGGEGLGYGLPASLGAAIAQRDSGRLVVDIQPDGDLMYTPEALWTAAHHKLPLLIVMHNNRTYGKDELHQAEVARTRRGQDEPPPRGIRLESPDIDFAGLARAQGVEAVGPVEDPATLDAVLAEAAATVANERRPVLVDVVCSR
jgi:thiamine pyrophosphate-dependent acetolactate synthase large subunit-like protein